MFSLSVVEDFYIVEYRPPCIVSGFESFKGNHFGFDGLEETLDTGIVIAVSLAAHAAEKAMLIEQLLKLTAGVLTPSIGVVNQTRRRLTASHSLSESVYDKIFSQTPLHRPANHLTGKQIKNSSQVKPALIRRNVCYVTSP